MGAWGTGPFENDDALDFAGEVETLQHLTDEVSLTGLGDLLEADKASRLVVVGECVAAMRGHRHTDMPDDLAQRVHSFGQPSDDLFEQARECVSLVLTNSELADLRAESEDRGAFNRAMTDLIDRLNQPATQKKKPPKRRTPTNNSPCWICGEPMGGEFTSISVTLDPKSGMSRGGCVHLACLNAALHPKYMIQDWKFDDSQIDRLVEDIFGETAKD